METQYSYDGDGRRVKKVSNGTTTVYVYDAMGQLAAEYTTQANPASGRQYLTSDHLGSTRLVTNQNGSAVKRYDYLPFGEEIPAGQFNRSSAYSSGSYPAVADTATALKFTGKERDAESGLDYFGARYFSGAQGRFTTTDPTFMTGQRISDPQQWNLYAYTRNNPLKFVDPDGRELKLAIYYRGVSQPVATRAAQTMVTKFQNAGVMNVSYELQAGAPSSLTTLRYSVLPTPHSHLLELRNGTDTPNWVGQAIGRGNAGQNFGGLSALDVTSVRTRTSNETDLAQGLANEGAHEVAHDAVNPMYHLGHPESTDLMHPKGAAYPSWLKDPTLQFSEDVAAALRRKYNRPGEVEKTPRQPGQLRKPEEEQQ